jgi:chromosome segregation ATPase
MSTVTVADARAQLTRAEALETKEKRENAKREIERLRRDGAALLKQLRPLAAQVTEAQRNRLRLHGELNNARQQIDFYSTPLDPLTFPSDEDIAAHAQQLTLWKQRQRELLKQAESVRQREAMRPQAVALQDRINRMQFEISNLTAISEGRRPGDVAGGGISQGVEDFIGRMATP